jgi:hypothetical protein
VSYLVKVGVEYRLDREYAFVKALADEKRLPPLFKLVHYEP